MGRKLCISRLVSLFLVGSLLATSSLSFPPSLHSLDNTVPSSGSSFFKEQALMLSAAAFASHLTHPDPKVEVAHFYQAAILPAGGWWVVMLGLSMALIKGAQGWWVWHHIDPLVAQRFKHGSPDFRRRFERIRRQIHTYTDYPFQKPSFPKGQRPMIGFEGTGIYGELATR